MGPWGGFITGLCENVEYVLAPAVVVSFLALDFVIYIQHRLFHAVPLLWRLHLRDLSLGSRWQAVARRWREAGVFGTGIHAPGQANVFGKAKAFGASHGSQRKTALVKTVPFLCACRVAFVFVGAVGLQQIDGEEVGAHLVTADMGEAQNIFGHFVRNAWLRLARGIAVTYRSVAPIGCVKRAGRQGRDQCHFKFVVHDVFPFDAPK